MLDVVTSTMYCFEVFAKAMFVQRVPLVVAKRILTRTASTAVHQNSGWPQ